MDRFEPVRKHLRLAAGSLTVSQLLTGTLRSRVIAVEHQLDPNRPASWVGSPEQARADLEEIVAALKRRRGTRSGVATGVGKLVQDPAKVLLPGVVQAIDQLMIAVDLLKAMPEVDV